MRKTLSILILVFTVFNSTAQKSIAVIKNNLKASLNSKGFLFDSSGNSGLNKAVLSLCNGAGVWLSATDSMGVLRVAGHDLLGKNHEFWPGPLELSTGKSADSNSWNQVYPITTEQINFHRIHYKDENYQAINEILTWPGSKGSPYAQILAPFVDVKVNDRLYTPQTGDYPYINCSQLVYSITNDNAGQHAYSNSPSLGVEMHTSLYLFDATDSFLKNAVLVRYVVHNRSGRNYKNFRLSALTGFKIGSNENEFLGTDIPNKTLFAINDTTEATFKNKLVSLGCMAINQRVSSSMYYNDDNNLLNGRPTMGIHFYNLMQGKWKNGKSLGFGGAGTDGSGKARFVYPYTSDDSNNNIMWNEYGNIPGKRIGILNSDSTELKNGMAKVYDFVYFYVEENFNNIKQIGNFCLNINKALTDRKVLKTESVNSTKASKINLFPNPIKGGEKLFIDMNTDLSMFVRIIDINGKEIFNYNLHESENCIILPDNLVGGLYFIEIETLNTIERQILNIN